MLKNISELLLQKTVSMTLKNVWQLFHDPHLQALFG